MKASRVPTDGRQRGFSCALWTDPPGRGWADCVHPVDERLLPAEGEIERTVRGRTGRLTPGGRRVRAGRGPGASPPP